MLIMKSCRSNNKFCKSIDVAASLSIHCRSFFRNHFCKDLAPCLGEKLLVSADVKWDALGLLSGDVMQTTASAMFSDVRKMF